MLSFKGWGRRGIFLQPDSEALARLQAKCQDPWDQKVMEKHLRSRSDSRGFHPVVKFAAAFERLPSQHWALWEEANDSWKLQITGAGP